MAGRFGPGRRSNTGLAALPAFSHFSPCRIWPKLGEVLRRSAKWSEFALIDQFAIQEAIQAAEAFRDDPLFYFVVVGLTSMFLASVGGIVALYKENSRLKTSLMDLSRTATEAISAMTPIMQATREDQRESMRRIEQQLEKAVGDIRSHINILKNINDKGA